MVVSRRALLAALPALLALRASPALAQRQAGA
jgi:hypothetical protein